MRPCTQIFRAIGYVLLIVAIVPEASAQSPLASYPGFGHNPADDEALFLREEKSRQLMIAECMREAGFNYFMPNSNTDQPQTVEQALALVGTDSNSQYLASLAPERQREYQMALAGVPDPHSEEMEALGGEEGPANGCVRRAATAIPGVYAARSELAPQFFTLRTAIAGDPRVQIAEIQWRTCMWQKGFEHPSSVAMASMRDELTSTLQEPQSLYMSMSHLGTTDPRQRVAQLAYNSSQADSAAAQHILDAKFDRAADHAAGRCHAAHLSAVVAQVKSEYEAAFVAEHRAVLDAHLARIRGQVNP